MAIAPPSIEDVRGILRDAGVSARLDHLPDDRGGFERTHVWVLDEVVIKFDHNASRGGIARECNALELLAGTDLPVPRLLGRGTLDDGRPWLLMSRLDGQLPPDAAALVHEVSAPLAEQMGVLAARLHAAVEPPGFGQWKKRSWTFTEAARERTEVLIGMARRLDAVPRAELDGLIDVINATRPSLETAPPVPVLAHRDLSPRNVLVDGVGRISALIDFESSAGGDRLEDFRCLALDWTLPGFGAACRGYESAGGVFDADAAERLTHYVLNWALAIFAYLVPIVPAYLPPARLAIERVLAGDRPRLR